MTNVYKFGPHTIAAGQVFLKTKYSIGLVNLKPILPGHVLVVSLRPVRRFLDLNPEEVSDMFQSAQRIGKIIEKEYGGSSLTIACQDGADAGQSVPHVHVHIIPRRLGDFANNDDIYNDIARNGKEYFTKPDAVAASKKGVDNEERMPRTEQEMAAEASRLALLLEQQQQQQQQ
ncbi:HIT-like domain-containing protein [Dissophora ornata]|nr:HIT-like domain-containing protein [Dissophora ornata]